MHFVCLGLLVSFLSSPTQRWHRLELENASALEYVLLLPPDYEAGKTYPALLALPPGNQDRSMVERGLELYFEEQAAKRGWIVVSPAAPEGGSFYAGAEGAIGPLLESVLGQHSIEDGRFHLAGASNGGRAAFRVALENTGRIASIHVMPGYPPEEKDLRHLADVAHLPVSIWVGAKDASWVQQAERTRDALTALGAKDLLYEPRAGEDHVLDSSLAPLIFERLDDLRSKEQARERERKKISVVLDTLHRTASAADFESYFACFAPGAVFIGSDASERWTIPEFRAYAKPHFEDGTAWTYIAIERHIEVEDDLAWFDERLLNDKYGETRGSGVLRRVAGEWKIAHYVFSFVIPNEAAKEVTEVVKKN